MLIDQSGDYVWMITEPVEVHASGPSRPLRLAHAAHLESGHGNTERPDAPTERAAPG